MRFLTLVFNFRQRERSIVEYTREGDQPNAEYSENFRDVPGYQFIAGLNDNCVSSILSFLLGQLPQSLLDRKIEQPSPPEFEP